MKLSIIVIALVQKGLSCPSLLVLVYSIISKIKEIETMLETLGNNVTVVKAKQASIQDDEPLSSKGTSIANNVNFNLSFDVFG